MGKYVFFDIKESGGYWQHLIAKFSTLGKVAKSATFFIFLMFFTSPAQATAPQVKYMYLMGTTPAPIASRQAACVAFADYMKDMFTSPRVDPDAVSEEPNLVGAVANIRCLYNLVPSGEVDARSPGVAYCSPTTAGGGEFVIDKRNDTCVCPVGKKYYPDVDKCVTETPVPEPKAPPGKPSDNGPSCGGGAPQPKCGEPINPGTGNMWHIEDDYTSASPISALTIRRTYNSSPFNWDAAAVRSFGARWTQPFDAVLKAEKLPAVGTSYATCFKRDDTGTVSRCETASSSATLPLQAMSIVRGDGKRHFFKLVDGVWKGDATNSDILTPVFNSGKTAIVEWTYQTANGDTIERYSDAGQLISQTFRNGVTQRYTYSNGATNDSNVGRNPANAPACAHVQAGPLLPAGKLMCVTDTLGFKLHFEYDGRGRIAKAIDPAGQLYVYEYDGVSGGCVSPDANNAACSANNLTKVTYPDATSRTYMYNEAANINHGTACPGMPGVGNGFGNLLNAWTGYIDENGDRHISWTYDCLGRATSSEHADGVKKVKISYNADESYTSAVVDHYTGLPL
ncbi:RHS repeat protein, partial [Massilia sp. P8910]|uniref:RHS repeat domain-containing protein n=1 Tax=Massilia antarctica TaxID=2765360 RepID=UPI001E4381D6